MEQTSKSAKRSCVVTSISISDFTYQKKLCPTSKLPTALIMRNSARGELVGRGGRKKRGKGFLGKRWRGK